MTSFAKAVNLSTSPGHDPSSGSNAESFSVRNIAQDFLLRCKIPYPSYTLDLDYEKECCEVAINLGYPMSGNLSLRPFIPGGIAMSETTFAHVGDKEKRIFIAIYTASMMYADDILEHDFHVIRDFNRRFVQNERQPNGILEAFAKLLRGLPSFYDTMISDFIITSTLNLFSATSLEYELRGMNVSAEAVNYPKYFRTKSGASEAYALFVFPPEMPLQFYIQAMPDIMTFIDQGNLWSAQFDNLAFSDVLSYYKEDLTGDTVGYVPLVATVKGIPNIQALYSAVNEAVEAHDRVLQILAPHPEALEVFIKFSHGYIGFHSAAKRYRLNELNLK